jgi:peptide/nickel transport system permease protein
LNQRDTITVTGCIILTTVMISILMLIVDLLYALVDPRIKAMYSKGDKK